MKSRKALEKEDIAKAYLNYWRLQNNPDYIKFFDEAKKREQAGEGRIYEPPKEKGESDKQWLARVKYGLRERWPWADEKLEAFGLHFLFVNPYKQIDWKALKEGRPDSEILDCYFESKLGGSNTPVIRVSFLPEKSHDYFERLLNSPFVDVSIDLRWNKKDILKELSAKVNFWKEVKGIFSPGRDQLNKIAMYMEVWDLRKGATKKTYSDIARELRRPVSTLRSQFKEAFRLIYKRAYNKEWYEEVCDKLEGLKLKVCYKCSERSSCKDYCPDLLLQLKRVEGKQKEKSLSSFFDKDGEEKSAYEIISDRQAYLNWQQENGK